MTDRAFSGRKDGAGNVVYQLARNDRYYDPDLGRFLSPDPLGFAGGDVNLYVYAGNNPLVASDPMGLEDAKFGLTLSCLGWPCQPQNVEKGSEVSVGVYVGTGEVGRGLEAGLFYERNEGNGLDSGLSAFAGYTADVHNDTLNVGGEISFVTSFVSALLGVPIPPVGVQYSTDLETGQPAGLTASASLFDFDFPITLSSTATVASGSIDLLGGLGHLMGSASGSGSPVPILDSTVQGGLYPSTPNSPQASSAYVKTR